MDTPDIPARKAHLQKVLTAIETFHYKFDITNQTQLLATISRLTAELCEHIETLNHPRRDAIAAAIAHIETKETAAAITYLCLKELQSTHRRDAVVTVSTHTELSDDPDDTLGRMDLHIGTERRIRHLIAATGDLAVHWYAQSDQSDDYISREYAITSVAYQAACTLIATDRARIVN